MSDAPAAPPAAPPAARRGTPPAMPQDATGDNAGKFRKVSEIARLIHDSTDLADTLRRLVEGVCLHSAWTSSSIQALDPARQTTTPIVRHDPYRPPTEPAQEEWDSADSPLTRIIETGQPLVLEDAAAQDRYTGFREDARRRGYHTVVMIPLRFADDEGRAIVFTVKSNEVVAVDAAEMGFLQCLADLADIAVRRMQILHRESADARNLRDIIDNLTTALATSLDTDRATGVFSVLSRLFPQGWFAIDLTSGRALHDPAAASPVLDAMQSRLPDTLVRQALRADPTAGARDLRICLDGVTNQSAHMISLVIDGTVVGALILMDTETLSPHQQIAAQAGRFALSTLILRSYLAFRIRGHSARRLMKRLFSGDLAGQDDLFEEARILDFDLDRPMRLLALSCGDREPLGETPHVFVNRKARQQFGQAVSCIEGNRLFLLVHDDHAINDSAQRDAFLRGIQPVLPGHATIVRSGPIETPDQVALARALCLRNLQVAQSMRAEGWISGRKIGAFPTLMSSVSDTMAHEFLARTIEPIADGGSPKGLVAIETLDAFLRSGRRLQESADALGIHVSTLRYRLERLSARFDLDLGDPEKCFELELGLRLHDLRNSYQS